MKTPYENNLLMNDRLPLSNEEFCYMDFTPCFPFPHHNSECEVYSRLVLLSLLKVHHNILYLHKGFEAYTKLVPVYLQHRKGLILIMKKIAYIIVLAMCFLTVMGVPAVSYATTLTVNQSSGPYYSIRDAVNAANTGDIIEITDSRTYYESFVIGPAGRNISNVTIQGKAGEQPIISGEAIDGNGSVIKLENSGITIKNLTFYVGGAYCGIEITGAGNTIDSVSFDTHIRGRGTGLITFGALLKANATVKNCNFFSENSVLSGGILILPSQSVNINVNRCDFWGTGNEGGMVGMGVPAGSAVSVTECVFGAFAGANSGIIGINSWGSGTITENKNVFRNIPNPVIGFNSNTPNGTDKVTTGGDWPTDSAVLMTDTLLNSLLTYLGCTPETQWSYPDGNTLKSWLNKAVKSIDYDFFSPDIYDNVLGTTLKQNTLDFMSYTQPKMWFSFAASWGRQYDPYVLEKLRLSAAEVRQQPNLSNIILSGYIMECIEKNKIFNTSIPNDLWYWMAYNFPNASFRPLEVKSVNGRRWQAHWFNYNVMLGFGVNLWAPDNSVPNYNKNETLLYGIFLAKSYIDAGLNDIQIAQPQIMFGQAKDQNGYGGTNLQYLSRFARNYGHYKAPLVNGQRWATCGAATIVHYLKSYVNYNDYLLSPAGTDAVGSGMPWNTLNDAYNTLPPADLFVSNKPVILEIDNFGANDQITCFAKEIPSARQQWLVNYTNYIMQQRGFYLAQTGIRPIVPEGSQNYSGYQTPPLPWPWRAYFQPFNEYGGHEDTVRNIFLSH